MWWGVGCPGRSCRSWNRLGGWRRGSRGCLGSISGCRCCRWPCRTPIWPRTCRWSMFPGGAAIAFVEGLLGVWFITGAWLRPAGLVTLLLGPLAALLAGPVAMLEAIDLLGIALFLVVLPPGRDRYGAVEPPVETAALAIFALRVCAGLALVVLAFSEKFGPHPPGGGHRRRHPL